MELMLSSVSPLPERQCGDRPPAPGDLGLVQALVNSFWDLDTRQDRFATPAALAAWLLERDLIEPGTRLGTGDLHRALEVREGLRALLFVNNGSEPDRGAIQSLNRALRRSALSVVLDPLARPDFRAQGEGLDAVLALIAGIAAVAQLDGRWSRLKACRGEHCGWAFYDHSRNQAGSWCAMSVCGSRAKAREYRRRKRSSAP
jgi:predicted RNA-binding Zn ribbon-like protein